MSNNDDNKVTHFGYQQVPWQEKQQRVAGVFRSVAAKYDVMNDLISMGSHRVLKRMTLELAGVRPGHRVLDLAGGTGDLA
ncbi:MAG: class I SAM-dependent methyltransferase, partial [Alloalcanivorax venustensis]